MNLVPLGGPLMVTMVMHLDSILSVPSDHVSITFINNIIINIIISLY